MQTLKAFLDSADNEKRIYSKTGQFTDWLSFCDFRLESGVVAICDPAFAPPETDMEVSLQLPPGLYAVEGRGVAFGTDHRVAALRCVRSGSSNLSKGSQIGEVGVDTGRIGLCDVEEFGAAVDQIGEDAFSELLDESDFGAGVITPKEGVIFPFVDSGFGDGTYPVFGLRSGNELVGFEVILIAEDEKYPFSEERVANSGETQESKIDPEWEAKNARRTEFIKELLQKTGELKASGKVTGKEAFKTAMEQVMNKRLNHLLGVAQEYREHLVAQRKMAPVTDSSTKSASREILNRPELAERRKALEAAGYKLQGVYEFERIPNFLQVLFLHEENGTTGTISIGKTITTEVDAVYPNGGIFAVRDTAPSAGLTTAPWINLRYEPGLDITKLLAVFEKERPPGHVEQTEQEAVESLANDFKRIQEWRLERGGWNWEEVQAQLQIKDAEGHEDQIAEACANVREKWLYAWFKEKDPELAEQLLESVVIIHDELDRSILQCLWMMGGGSPNVRAEEFREGVPRQVFKKLNEAHGQPLVLVAQKTEGYLGDFYAPKQ
jgi:hypothetical protein